MPQRDGRETQGRPPARHARRPAQGGRFRPRDPARRFGKKSGPQGRPLHGQGSPDAAREGRRQTRAGNHRSPGSLGEDGSARSTDREIGNRRSKIGGRKALGFSTRAETRRAGGPERETRPKRDRQIHPLQARIQGPHAFAASGPAHAPPPRQLRSHRPSALTRGGSRVRKRQVTGRVCEDRRSPAGFTPLRRAVGPLLARRGALFRHQRLRLRGGTEVSVLLHLPGLGHPRLQRGPAVRPVHHPADRRRSAAARRRQARAGGTRVSHARPSFSQQPDGHHRRPD